MAAYRGNKEIVEMLIKAGADVNAQGGEYGTALQIAAARGDEDIVKLLVKNKASALVDSQARDGSLLLHAAVASGNLEILKNILSGVIDDAGKFLGKKDASGQTPFLLAATSADLRIPETLYSFMEDPSSAIEERDIDGRTPLHLAVEGQNTKTVQWLLDKGAKADIADFGNTTPIQLASESGNFQILSRLFSKMSGEERSINASKWRSISGTTGGTIEMTKGHSATVKILGEGEFGRYMNDRSYSLALPNVDIPAKEMSLAKDTTEKRLL